MKSFLKSFLIGQRMMKTGIAVAVTSFICLWFNLPAIYAVITAIVTIEPNTYDSVRKGMVRFPAAAIGAGIATLSVYFLGETFVTYTIAALGTIYLCQKLKLFDGTLVATLTAVAMIPELDGPLFMQFITRLSTTMIGISVSSIVNITIFPANYFKRIHHQTFIHIDEAKRVLQGLVLPYSMTRNVNVDTMHYMKFKRSLAKTDQLMGFQRKELRVHRFRFKNHRNFLILRERMDLLHRLELHLGNLQFLGRIQKLTLIERELLDEIARLLPTIDYYHEDEKEGISDEHFKIIHELDQALRYEYGQSEQDQTIGKNHYLNHNTRFFYELLSSFEILGDLYSQQKNPSL